MQHWPGPTSKRRTMGAASVLLLSMGPAFLAVPLTRAQAQSTPPPIPTAPFTNINPSWSPDERQIVFESRRHGRVQLYIVNADGTGERRLTWTKGDDTHPAWSPDGSRIMFDSTRDGNTWNLFEIRPDGTGLRRLTYPAGGAASQTARHPQWSLDGRWVVFDSNRDGDDEIYMIAADGSPSTTRRLTTSPGQDGHPAFTPDGRILFGSARSGNDEVWVIDPDGSNPRPLTDHPAPDRAGRMSPDGRFLLFNSERDGNGELYVADVATGALRNVTRHPDTVFEASWSPSGKRIAFYSDRTGRFEIYTMASDGGDVRQVTSAPYENAFPSWLPDGRIVYSSTQAEGDWEIFVIDPKGGDPLRITQSPGRDAHAQAWTEGRLLFQSPRAWPQPPNVDIFVMASDGSRIRRLTGGGGFNGVPVPSPDASRIAFMRGQPRAGGFHWQIHVMDADGGHERAVTSGTWSSQVPTWTGDGKALFIHADPEGRNQLYKVDLATGRVAQAHKSSGNDHAPALATDGIRLAFTSDRDNAPGRHDLYVLDLGTGGVRRLTQGLNVRGQPGWSPDSMSLTIAAAPADVSDVWVIPVGEGEPRRVTRGAEGQRPW